MKKRLKQTNKKEMQSQHKMSVKSDKTHAKRLKRQKLPRETK